MGAGAERSPLHDLGMLIVGASFGIGRAVAVTAASRGVRLALAARRGGLLRELVGELGGTAHEVDIADPAAVERVVGAAADALGDIDVLFVSSAVMPAAPIHQTSAQMWSRVLAVNAIGPGVLLSAALPRLRPGAVAVVVSSDGVGRPRVGLGCYSASKAALDEILTAWRVEHPELALIRLLVGPTAGTDILREMDKALATELLSTWMAAGQVPTSVSSPDDVAAVALDLITAARSAPSVVPAVITLAPR